MAGRPAAAGAGTFGPIMPIPALGAPVDLGRPGQGVPDFGRQQAEQALAVDAPQITQAPGFAPIAPDPYIGELNERNEEQQRFEAEHGRFATAATQTARGVLDFVFSLGATPVAIAAQSAGSLFGSKGLEDFGREYGEAATGTSAMATLFGSPVVEAASSLVGGENNRQKALSSYEQSIRDIHEQQEAWPMLSTVSHFAGAVGASLGLGAAAGGAAAVEGAVAPTLGQTLARAVPMGAFEGSTAGAQSAYDEGRPLRDVLGSALMGGLLGGATAGAFQSGAHYFESGAFSEGLDKFALDRTGKAIGVIGKRDVTRLGGVEGVRRMAKDVAEHVLDNGEKVFPDSVIAATTMPLEDIAERIHMGREELGAKLGSIRSTVGEFIDNDAPELRPNVRDIIDKIKTDVLDQLESDPIAKNRAGPIRDIVAALEQKAGLGANSTVNSAIDEVGAKNSVYARDGMRDLTEARSYYRGASKAEAEQTATTLSKPIDVAVEPDDGRMRVILQDGRHRMTAADEAGADHILARVRTYDADGNIIKTEVRPISIRGGGKPITDGSRDGTISLSDLRSVQESLKREVYPKSPGGGLSALVSPAREEQQAVERLLEDEVTKIVDRGASRMAKAGDEGAELASQYMKTKRLASSFIHADQVSTSAAASRLGNRGASLTDTLVGAGAFAGDLASGGGVGAAAKALGMTALHRYARLHGSAFMAALANKLAGHSEELGETLAKLSDKLGEANIGAEGEAVAADAHAAAESEERGLVAGTAGGNILQWLWPKGDHQIISVDAAGGREAQGVIATLERARQKVNEQVESAGPNPIDRQSAQMVAMHTISAQLAAKAGPFNPTTWAEKPPTPLQKVIHRPEILNQVSTDLAHDAAHAAALKPSPDFDLLYDRVKTLTRDADGPTAIGGVQQTIRQMAMNAPPTPTGDQIRLVARMTLQHLSDSDVPSAMTTGHQLARQLSVMSDGASDQITKDYVARQVTMLQQTLSDQSFGKAGAVYAKLTAEPSPTFQQLLDPAALRDALVNAQSRGVMPAALKELATNILDAHEARTKLGGGSMNRSVASSLKQLEAKFAKAEDAVTLDGGPAGRVLDFFSGKPGADARGLKGSPEMLVMNVVRPQMEKLLPVLGKQSDRYTGVGPEKPSIPNLPRSTSELQSLYTDRMQTLAAAVTGQDTSSAAAAMKGMPNVSPAVQAAVMTDSQQRMAKLLQDMPKPTKSLRGKAFETLSSDDLRKANAMWEATTKPMSVFSDFHAGTIDYDKARYTWTQYPGLQQASQAGLMDVLHAHLDDNQRAAIPDSMLTQLDYLLGFGGTLQTSVDRGFSQRMTAIAAAESQKKPQQNGPLDLETSKPTFTERLAGARKG